MKRFFAIMLGLSLILGTASVSFAQGQEEKKEEKKKGKKGKKGKKQQEEEKKSQ